MEEMEAEMIAAKLEESRVGPIVATEAAGPEAEVAELHRRVGELEAAVSELRTVRAAGASVGRKTAPALMAKGIGAAGAHGVDDALKSLSVEQRIAVKSGLLRAGLL